MYFSFESQAREERVENTWFQVGLICKLSFVVPGWISSKGHTPKYLKEKHVWMSNFDLFPLCSFVG